MRFTDSREEAIIIQSKVEETTAPDGEAQKGGKEKVDQSKWGESEVGTFYDPDESTRGMSKERIEELKASFSRVVGVVPFQPRILLCGHAGPS